MISIRQAPLTGTPRKIRSPLLTGGSPAFPLFCLKFFRFFFPLGALGVLAVYS
jgi:hypothetical protein